MEEQAQHRDTPVTTVMHAGYTFGSEQPFSKPQLDRLVYLLNQPRTRSASVLGGRFNSEGAEVLGLGRVFIKHYARGGLLRFVSSDTFLKFKGASRPEAEYDMLTRVRSLGVNVPKPLAFVTRGSWRYRGWLVTEELQGTRTLVEVGESEDEVLHKAISEVARQLSILIDHRILHIDFHPGNVLVDRNGEIFLVDFDKARVAGLGEYALREWYIRRWRRAVIKHKLPQLLNELIALKLKSIEGELHSPRVDSV